MTNIELVLNMLAEVTTTTMIKAVKPKTFDENKTNTKKDGTRIPSYLLAIMPYLRTLMNFDKHIQNVLFN